MEQKKKNNQPIGPPKRGGTDGANALTRPERGENK